MNGWSDRNIEGETGRHRQTDRQTDIHTDRNIMDVEKTLHIAKAVILNCSRCHCSCLFEVAFKTAGLNEC
jgi:hypothetical protein